MFEAMAAEVPIILGVRGIAADLVEANSAGISIPPEDADALVSTIDQLRSDDSQRKRFGSNGHQLVRESFSWDQIARQYAADLEETVYSH
jgi:glycosyltransferase involved in cell wall biosynthesis